MPSTRSLLLGTLLLALGCASGGALTETHTPALDQYQTRTELDNFLGTRQTKCVHSRPGYELCGWILGNRSEAWEPIAESVDTRRKVNVVCELPTENGRRSPGSCSVYPRIFLPFELAVQRAPVDVAASQSAAASEYEQAHYALETARDIVQLSRLAGVHPRECHRRSETHQLCRWRLSNQPAGHRLLAAASDLDGRLQLECLLPYSGAPRSRDSCQILPPR